MQPLITARTFLTASLRRTAWTVSLAAALGFVVFEPLRASVISAPEPRSAVSVHVSAAPISAAEALPSLPQRLTAWLYSVERSVQQSALPFPGSQG